MASKSTIISITQLRLHAIPLTIALAVTACGGSSSSGDGAGGGGPGGPEGGGPVGPNTTDDIPTETSLTGLNGLSAHADHNEPLLYIDASHDNGQTGLARSAALWLMSYDPQADAKVPVDKNVGSYGIGADNALPVALHGADVDPNSGEMTNYHINSVVYLREKERPPLPGAPSGGPVSYCSSELMRVDVGNNTPVQVTDETGCSADVGALSNRQMVAFDLANPETSQYVFDSELSGSSGGEYQYRMTPLNADNGTPVKSFDKDFTVQSFLSDAQGTTAGEPFGWLVADKSQSDCLALVDQSDLNSATCIPNASGGSQVALPQNDNFLTDFISGIYLMKNGAVISLPEGDQSNPLAVNSTLWFYEYGTNPGDVGQLHLLTNNAGDELQTEALPLIGQEQAGRVVNKNGDTLYMAVDDGGFGGLISGGEPTGLGDIEFHVNLLKITTESGNIGWEHLYHQGGKIMQDKDATLGEFLVDAGNRLLMEVNAQLISLDLDGNNKKILDGRDNSGSGLGGGALETPIGVISDSDWFFYNREYGKDDYATAIRVDGTQRVELKGCRWIGASTSGSASFVGVSFASLIPSEMFMACNNKRLAVVDADDPEKGQVELGTLDQEAEAIEMRRAAPGPHRLARVTYKDGSDESFEVVYVDVGSSNSLKHLMTNPVSDDDVGNLSGLTRPINGF